MSTKIEERKPPDSRDSARAWASSATAAPPSSPLPSAPSLPPPCRTADPTDPCAAALAPLSAALQSSLREEHRESEKLGLTEMMLGAERYRSILEIGCGTGELAGRLTDRCARYTGMDEAPARLAAAARAVRAGHFLPLRLAADEPFALPAGEHELIVLSDVLHRLDTARLERLAAALEAHAACREIVVISPLGGSPEAIDGRHAACGGAVAADDEGVEHRADESVERRLDVLASAIARLECHALALRGHYRIDALLPPDAADEPVSEDARRAGGQEEDEGTAVGPA